MTETATEDRICEGCEDEDAIVGWGTPPKWLGINCYQAALQQLSDQLRRLRGSK